MAAYIVDTKVYPSELFVESCGAVLFDISPAPSSSPSSGVNDSGGGGDGDSGLGGTPSSLDDDNDNDNDAENAKIGNTKVCLLHYIKKDQWLLPKGRRNCSETRQEATVREVREESGYACRLRPVTMPTRAPSAAEAADVVDAARMYDDLTEPFMLEVRDLGGSPGAVKLVWWFVAELLPGGHVGEAEAPFEARFLECDVALQKLTFQKDRDVLRRAIDLVQGLKH